MNLQGVYTVHTQILNLSEWRFSKWEMWTRGKYFHNDTQLAMARAEATLMSATLPSGTFPDLSPSEDGCNMIGVSRDLSYFGGMSFIWDGQYNLDLIEILAVDSCASFCEVRLGHDILQFCSDWWVEPENPIVLVPGSNSHDPLTRSSNVFVKISASRTPRERVYEILADGVYFPATGRMHLVGCTRKQRDSPPLLATPATAVPRYRFSDSNAPPLNSTTPDDCAISVTVQYPPMNCRWNKDRVLNYTIRSQREKNDPLYFDPIQRSAFFAYTASGQWLQGRLETGIRVLLLVLGLACVALQIKHGRHNEESLPFVSLDMLHIQVANHLSQTSIFKDLQIGRYVRTFLSDGVISHWTDMSSHRFPDELNSHKYYGAMMMREHVPYQPIAMAAIFMYVWIFFTVTGRRRVREMRVVKKRTGAKDPPSEWPVTCATLTFFSLLCFLGFFATRADQYGHIRRALTGMTATQDRHYAKENPWREGWWNGIELEREMFWQVHWGFINKMTGLVVSLFLVPQLLGNMQWEVQGHRPLSSWFYIGIPFLQSMQHVFTIAKHFEVLPIFSSYDPYLDSASGIYEKPSPWWSIGVVIFSTLQVLAMRSQFSRSRMDGASWHLNQETAVAETCEILQEEHIDCISQ